MSTHADPRLGLVEDSAEDFAAFERIVSREAPGVTVRRWPTAEALLADLAEATDGAPWPTALVIDLNLPGIDGAELVRQLRAGESTRSLPAFVLSGSERQVDVDRCYAAGANAYLTKPGGTAELRALLRMLLASLATFRTPTSLGGADGLSASDLAGDGDLAVSIDDDAIEQQRAQYEEELQAERSARKRAEALQRLSARLADATAAEQVERHLLDIVRTRPAFGESQIERAAGESPHREAFFMPSPFGDGSIALLPLLGDRDRVHAVLRVEVPAALSDDDEALLHQAASLASQALARIARQPVPGSAGDQASDLPTARWWRDTAAAVLRDAGERRQPVTLVVIEVGVDAVAADAGYIAADERLLAVVDAWRTADHDLLSPLGTDVLVALLPGFTGRQAQQLANRLHETLEVGPPPACAVAEWTRSESGDELLARARGAIRRA